MRTSITGLYVSASATVAILLSTPAFAAPIAYTPTTADGIVPGTAINYTISVVGGSARNIFPSAQSDNAVFIWNNGFPEFLTTNGTQTMTVNFSAPVELNRVVIALNSVSTSSSLSIAGGTATTSDFDLFDSLQVYTGPTGAGTYTPQTPSTATFSFAGGAGNKSAIIGSTSFRTISSFTLATSTSNEGFTQSFGVTNQALVVVPEASTFALVLPALAMVGAVVIRRRKK